MTDAELQSSFESCTLPHAEWTHRAHLRIAYLYSGQSDLTAALSRMRAGIRAYNQATNTPEALDRGYHETITQAFMRLVFAARHGEEPCASSLEFCDRHPDLLNKLRLRQYYSPERIMTWQAKAAFVPPDLAPLPRFLEGGVVLWNVLDGSQLTLIRQLFREYAESLAFDLAFQDFESELAHLSGAYGPPTGRLLLASKNRTPAGCVALREIDQGVCEMKRLWVRSPFRGTGLGRQLVQAVIDEARELGYRAMRLDTVPAMQPAIQLYRSFGFQEIAAYCLNPIPGAIFLELDLTTTG